MSENENFDLILTLSFISLFFFVGLIVSILACIYEIEELSESIEVLYDLLGVTL